MGGDGAYQNGRQAVIWLHMKLADAGANCVHFSRSPPPSMTNETKAAKAGAAQPFSSNSSGWMKSINYSLLQATVTHGQFLFLWGSPMDARVSR